MTLYLIKASFVDWVNCIEHLSHLVHTPCGIRNWCRASNSISADKMFPVFILHSGKTITSLK